MTRLVVGVKEGAAILGVSQWVFRNLIADGLLPTVRFPSAKCPGESNRRILVAVADLEAFVAKYREVTR